MSILINHLQNMNEQLNLIKEKIISLLKNLGNELWVTSKIEIQFPPFINRGLKGATYFYDSEGKQISLIIPDYFSLSDLVGIFIFKHNKKSDYNTITFSCYRNDYSNAVIEVSFSQEVEDNFRNNLPKSWRKKTIVPWWKNPEETKNLNL